MKPIVLYHVVYKHEKFEHAAKALFELVQTSQRDYPDKPRILSLDIEGHRTKDGGFDQDMFELQKDFALGFLSPFLTEIHIRSATSNRRNHKPTTYQMR